MPDKAYFSLNACVKTLKRVFSTKKHLLEWMTAEDAEKNAKKDVLSYYKNMASNIVLGILALILLFILPLNLAIYLYYYLHYSGL